MKKAFRVSLVILLLIGSAVCGGCWYQNRSNQGMLQAIQDWKNNVSMARLDGKDPKEIAAYLDHRRIAHETYSGLLQTSHDPARSKREGYLLAKTGTVAQTVSLTGINVWHVEMRFWFNAQNKCKGCVASATTPVHSLIEE